MRVKDAVATCLTEAAGQYLSGETLAQKLGVSRNAVWKAVRLLQEEGFPIEAKKKTGYRLAQGIDLLTEETVRPYLHSRILGHPLYVYPELPSTTTPARRWCGTGQSTAQWLPPTARLPEKADRAALLCPLPDRDCTSL